MQTDRSAVTYCGRAKLLNLLDGKFGVFFVSRPTGSLELHFCDRFPKGHWVQIEDTPRVFVDTRTFRKIRPESSIDFDFNSQEFIIRKSDVVSSDARR
jgi:hypothetical protein